MGDPLDTPPTTDHGSDRYDYIEVAYALGVGEPEVEVPAELAATFDPVCPDCRANLFVRFDGAMWTTRIGHDDGCPIMEAIPNALPMWTVYDHPLDMPNFFVAREWFVHSRMGAFSTKAVIVSDDIGRVRGPLAAAGLYRMDKFVGDDPNILEVWM